MFVASLKANSAFASELGAPAPPAAARRLMRMVLDIFYFLLKVAAIGDFGLRGVDPLICSKHDYILWLYGGNYYGVTAYLVPAIRTFNTTIDLYGLPGRWGNLHINFVAATNVGNDVIAILNGNVRIAWNGVYCHFCHDYRSLNFYDAIASYQEKQENNVIFGRL
jgi:hypothetical protein